MKYHPVYLLIAFFVFFLFADIVKPGIWEDLLLDKGNYREYRLPSVYLK
jgi:phosphatidylglycerophosphatase A